MDQPIPQSEILGGHKVVFAGLKWDPEAPREAAGGSGSHSRDLPFPPSPRCASINDLLVAVLEPWETGGEFPCLLTSRNPLSAPLGAHFFKSSCSCLL